MQPLIQTCPVGVFAFAKLRGFVLAAALLSFLVGCEEPTAMESLLSQGVAATPEALLEATIQNETHVIDLLTAAGVRPDGVADESGRTPLMLAAASGFSDAATRLLKHSEDLDALDRRGTSALGHALLHGHLDISKQLLAAGASPDIDGEEGEPLLVAAVMHSQPEAMQQLLEHGARAGLDDALLIAVTERKVPMVERLLSAGADPDSGAGFQMPALNVALQNGDRESIDLLLASGATPNHLDDDSMRALGYAILEGDPALVSELLARSADPDLPCVREFTPMEIAVRTR